MLHEADGFSQLVDHYNVSNTEDVTKWLRKREEISDDSKQGVTGVFDSRSEPGLSYVYKISLYEDFLVRHEEAVCKSLGKISKFCPNFCKGVGTGCIRGGEVMLYEHIKDGELLLDLVRKKSSTIFEIAAIAKQTLLAICLAQRACRFTHYDLHSNNIIIRKLPEDVSFLYVLDEQNQFLVRSRGVYPVIIDYGYAYADELQGAPLWSSLAHTDVGFTSDRFDWVADPKLFLVTLSFDVLERKKPGRRQFRKVAQSLFGRLDIDMESGWDVERGESVANKVSSKLDRLNKREKLKIVTHYSMGFMDILQSLITLPLEPQQADLCSAFRVFARTFRTIERQIPRPKLLPVFKEIVDSARTLRHLVLSKDKGVREKAIRAFGNEVFDTLRGNVGYNRIMDNLDVDSLLCSLLVLGRAVERELHRGMEEIAEDKRHQYEQLPFESTEEVVAELEEAFPEEDLSEQDRVVVIDAVRKNCDVIRLSKEAATRLNKIHPLCRGTLLYKNYLRMLSET